MLASAGVLAGAVVATFAIEHALLTHDFSLVYVAQNSSRETPLLYQVTGMWSSLAGSILLWGLVLSLYLAAISWIYRRSPDQTTVAWVLLVALVVAAFFFGMMLGPSDPFSTHLPAPHDGTGPNPLLQDRPLVAFHPPLLYAGLVGLTVPFGFAVAGLVKADLGTQWASSVRRWTLLSWGCLGAGLVLGAWWSYQVLGWGGFWGWDPVENAALVPWLVATALLHSVVVQERRAILRVWNVSLAAAAFCLSILATFLTRSGVLESVHAFSNSDIGPYLIALFGAAAVCSIGLIAWRGDVLRSPVGIDSPLSREGAFLANNVVFAGFAFVVLLGTVFPLAVEAVSGSQVTVGAPYFDRAVMPEVVALLFLMAVAPALPWRTTTVETALRRLIVPGTFAVVVLVLCVVAGVRGLAPLGTYGLASFAGASALRQLAVEVRAARRLNPDRPSAWLRALTGRSGGGMVVHLGVVVIAVGLASSLSYGHRTDLNLKPGQSARFDGHRITYLGIRNVVFPNRSAIEANLVIDRDHPARPALSVYQAGGPAVGTPAVDSGLEDDVYVTLDMTPSAPGGSAEIGVIVQPLVIWLWIGGAVVAFGALLSMARNPVRRPRTKTPAGKTAGERELVAV
jgi:cytochrome c-type biogenesis protein CcmF